MESINATISGRIQDSSNENDILASIYLLETSVKDISSERSSNELRQVCSSLLHLSSSYPSKTVAFCSTRAWETTFKSLCHSVTAQDTTRFADAIAAVNDWADATFSNSMLNINSSFRLGSMVDLIRFYRQKGSKTVGYDSEFDWTMILSEIVLPSLLLRIPAALPDPMTSSSHHFLSSNTWDLELFQLLKLLQQIGKLHSTFAAGLGSQPSWGPFVSACSDFLLQLANVHFIDAENGECIFLFQLAQLIVQWVSIQLHTAPQFVQAALELFSSQCVKLWIQESYDEQSTKLSNSMIISSSKVELERQSRRQFLLQLLVLSKQILSSPDRSEELTKTVSHCLVVLLSFWDENCDSFDLVIHELDFQDDYLVASISALLDLWILSRSLSTLKTTYPALPRLLNQITNPHIVFFSLLKSTSFDASVLVDFLIDQDDGFAEYLVKYLRLVQADSKHFHACVSAIDVSGSDEDEEEEENDREDDPVTIVKAMLVALSEQLKEANEKNLFVYNTASLRRQLESSTAAISI